MLEFFKKAARVYLFVFFWLIMIGDLITGIILGNIVDSIFGAESGRGVTLGISVTLDLWIVTVFLFSIIGSFIALVKDVEAIRKKIESNGDETISVTQSSNIIQTNEPKRTVSNEMPKQQNNSVQSTPANPSSSSRFWICPDCGSYNPHSVSSCENCGTQKPN